MKFKNDYKNKIKKYVEEHQLTYYIDTMGCQMNENDSEKYSGILEDMGFKKAISNEANLYLFNTCCVRENAENTLFGRLGKLKEKIKQKDLYIIVVGCMTEQEKIVDKIKKSYAHTNIVLGTNSMNLFPKKLYDTIFNQKNSYEFKEETEEILEEVPIVIKDKYKASVSIIYGCNNFCSYCIVPYVRGRERSRNPKDIINDIKSLAKKGYKEITLLGQNVNSYGNDLQKRYSFSQLLKDVEKIKGIEIIRFTSPHPKDFKDELIETIKNSEKIAKQIHLPLQSGSNRILEKMNRKYTKEEYLEIVKKLKEADKEIAISTDIIVGFPGENENDFLETLDVIEKVSFDQIYMFIYSKRFGTKAAIMEDITPKEEKIERIERLKRLYEKKVIENNKKMLGKRYKVLIEGKSKNNNNLFTGRTSQNKVVIFEATELDIGKIVEIEIIKDHLWYLDGKII